MSSRGCRGSKFLQFLYFIQLPHYFLFFYVLSLEMVCILSNVCLQFSKMKKRNNNLCVLLHVFLKKQICLKEAPKGFNT